MFFIVLDLRLTKIGARRCSFFYACIFRTYKKQEVHPHEMKYTSMLTINKRITSVYLSKPAEVRASHRSVCRHKQKPRQPVYALRAPVFH
ncbi:hypothetical protein F3B51_20150 [Bacteroides ovatus]|uniref:Uncharacterized protein n=1 Tax=Bacteroides ovatus TaxID=28116 RepID=A0A5N4ERE3_BACOV|nr:hypothetical protein F3F61_10460 [Bacteroides ovatus]KAA4560196.1 hypothetical protein F3B68_20475 [Bacteroides ovatus]KAA4561543.1 hypothetical protein F3C56_19270 [Bacteroides ovatus]KAA4566245.1 hypothetical protein F3B65_20320 [Bacteroides ovatus]KAA4575836.1 hypothetical protein F3B64_19615 [Bacteroides ovatus]